MDILNLELDNLKFLIPQLNKDSRGSFVEKLNIGNLSDFGVKQINQSLSKKNVFRGFHFQKSPKEQAKYIWVEKGAILDFVININPESSQFKKHIIIELNDLNNHHLFIPRGFAHGFISLKDDTKVCYAVDNFYDPNYDSGINYMDESLEINWPVSLDSLIVSEKDKQLPMLKI